MKTDKYFVSSYGISCVSGCNSLEMQEKKAKQDTTPKIEIGLPEMPISRILFPLSGGADREWLKEAYHPMSIPKG